MKYRHRFHAGNFADVHKHVTLLALIASLQRKDKGFLYLETHAGRGRYELDGADTHQGAEARLGIGDCRNAPPPARSSAPTSPSVARARTTGGRRRSTRARRCSRRSRCAAGSGPLLRDPARRVPGARAGAAALPAHALRVRRWLRGPEVAVAAARAARAGAHRSAVRGAGPRAAARHRGRRRGARAARQCRGRCCGIRSRTSGDSIPGCSASPPSCRRRRSSAELWLHPRDSRVALNGSGLLIVHPPYQLRPRDATVAARARHRTRRRPPGRNAAHLDCA